MHEQVSGLCCCEYYDENHEVNHILACCCNCTDLDAMVDGLIRGNGVNQEKKSKFMATAQDRLRIPWRGGAKQIQFDAILPLLILPVILLCAAVNLWWTVFAFTTMIVFLVLLFHFFIRSLPRTKFFLMWTITSSLIIYFVFEFIVIPFLEILLEENLALTVFIIGAVACAYFCKVRMNQLNEIDETEGGYEKYSFNVSNCQICQKKVPSRDHHCIWLDCCIGRHNQCLFILSLLFAIIALLYSSNLTLTSVCHPFVFYKTILLPDDCSDVYLQYELGLSFVAALYSLFIAAVLLILLSQQLLFVSLGLTAKEWRKLPCRSKLFLGIFATRPHSRGFFRNWSRIIYTNGNHYSSVL